MEKIGMTGTGPDVSPVTEEEMKIVTGGENALMRKCPYCGRLTLVWPEKCMFCGRDKDDEKA